MSDLYSDHPPLWKAMDQATMRPFSSNSEIYGAQLRAIAKAMAEAEHRGEFTSSGLYLWLLAEADRAEAQP